ncbi:MAG: DNA polymerase III subunit alpha [Jiangellales bacterium]
MSRSQFVHLHNHTEYSMLDGAARVGELLDEAATQGMSAVGITDHGNMFGAFDFYTQATKRGIKPVIGIEAYLTPRTSRFDRTRVQWNKGGDDDVSGGGAFTHLTLLAESTTGMHNLFRLSSLASIEGFFYKPRMDTELLSRYSEGVIALTGCASSEIQTWLRIGRYDEARRAAGELSDIFGAGNLYVELMDHGIDVERRAAADLLRLAREMNLPLVATNDLHYTKKEDAEAHGALLCVQSGSTLNDPKRFKFDASSFYLRPADEMRELFAEVPEACDNTLAIAERCEVEFVEGADLMPKFDVPAGESEATWLAKEVERGLHVRFGETVPDDVRTQATYETDVVTSMGFPGYFLVVGDFIRWAKEQGIRVGPGRGSAAGSVVAYALGITDLNPLEHGLLFERFLNPERVSMPDIDIDFDERRRGDVIAYVTEKYGEERVAQIVTYGTIKAKQAIKDAARVLGYPYGLGDKLTKAYPPGVMGKDMPLAGVFDAEHARYAEAGEFRTLYDTDPDVKRVVDIARGLENLKRQWGVHAAGVIMSAEPLIDVIPIMKREQDGAIITQFDYGSCEKLGLLKMDFLGLRNLTVLDDALVNVRVNRGIDVDLDALTLDDPATYELLARGDTLGVFQLDGGPMRGLLRLMKPDSFEDISAVLALYRPGPMGANSHTNYALRKNGQQPSTPIHPELAEPLADILDTTYGLIVYQEQVMAIAQRVAGYSLGAADLLRRAMGKKKKEILDKEFEPFAAGMRENGYSQGAITTLWDILVPFSDYAFNKAHTAGYGLVSYWTAYLKANYPAEYMAALLTSVRDDKDKSALYLNECRRMGIKVLPPDVNESHGDFTPVGTDIRFGLAAIRNVGGNVVDAIVAARESHGRFADFGDFMNAVPAVVCNKRVIESLIKAGAFDSFGYGRRSLVAVHEEVVEAVSLRKRNEAVGQFDLFAADPGGSDAAAAADDPNSIEMTVVDLPEWDKAITLAYEREMLGLYVSDHPLMGLEPLLATKTDRPIAALADETSVPSGSVVTIAGLASGVQRRVTKKGDTWAVVTLEDLEGSVEVMVFPQMYNQVGARLAQDAVLVVKGRVDHRDEGMQLIAMEVTEPDLSDARVGPVVLAVPAARCTPPMVTSLREVLASHPGTTEVMLRLEGRGRTTVMKLDDGFRVAPTPALMGDLKALLGPGCLVSGG